MQPEPGDVLRVLGHIGLPGEAAVARMDSPTNPESTGTTWEVAVTALERTTDLLHLTHPSLVVPELEHQLFDVNWNHLRETYEAYERLGIAAEVVMGPEGYPLDFWRTVFSNLRQWQDTNHPDAPHRLKNQSDGEGLWVNAEVAAHWEQLVDTDNPRWQATVIPTPPKAPILGVDHNGKARDNTVPEELANILRALPGSDLTHPPTESYLMLQATRLHTGQAPVDSYIDSLYYWSWLDGEFTVRQDGKDYQAAPGGGWDPGSGQVVLDWNDVGDRDDSLGVRLSGRGNRA
jgi:hypothetical protein